MMRLFAALFCGLLFGAGLVISDMINPARVLGFLDIAGTWDYSLALVMGGALVPSCLAYAVRRRLQHPVCAEAFSTPKERPVDVGIYAGSALFGAGWGLSGFCPGPAVAALAAGLPQAALFVVAMVAGMALHRFVMAPPSSMPSG